MRQPPTTVTVPERRSPASVASISGTIGRIAAILLSRTARTTRRGRERVGYITVSRQKDIEAGGYRQVEKRAVLKAGILVRKAHRTITNQRKDTQHKAARRIVQTYGTVAVEGLNIAGMVQNHSLAKSISDAAWGQFISILRSKAASAWVVVVTVNPSGTSQMCSGCEAKPERPKMLTDRWHECAACGLSIQRDVNAARNIFTRAGLARCAAGAQESHAL